MQSHQLPVVRRQQHLRACSFNSLKIPFLQVWLLHAVQGWSNDKTTLMIDYCYYIRSVNNINGELINLQLQNNF